MSWVAWRQFRGQALITLAVLVVFSAYLVIVGIVSRHAYNTDVLGCLKADGCDRPFAWCEIHHQHAWALGGLSDLANAVPLCHFHHRRIHDHRYRHTRAPDGSIVFRLVA